MYVPDGHPGDYPFKRVNTFFYAWGWLSSEHDFKKGMDPFMKKLFLEILKSIKITNLYRGSHIDEGLSLTYKNKRKFDVVANGSIKFKNNGLIYTAPSAVIYYIEHLDYYPPTQVIDALFEYSLAKER